MDFSAGICMTMMELTAPSFDAPSNRVVAVTTAASGDSLMQLNGTAAYGQSSLISTANDTLAAPVGASLVRLVAFKDNSHRLTSLKNGAAHSGALGAAQATLGRKTGASAIIPCVDTDRFSFNLTGSPAEGHGTFNWVSLEAIDAATKYALVYNSTDQIVVANNWLTLTWNSEHADTDGFHDGVVNNTRLSIPAGVDAAFARVTALVINYGITTGGYCWTETRKDGAEAPGMARQEIQGSTATGNFVASAIVPVTPGATYFEVRHWHEDNAGNILHGANNSWAMIETFPAGYKFAAISPVAGQALTANVAAVKTFGGVISDVHGCVSGNTIVAPAGVTQARASFNVVGQFASAGFQLFAQARKNASAYQGPGLPASGSLGDSEENNNGFGAWIDCAPGDIFDLVVANTSNCTLPAHQLTWFCVEFR